MINSIKKILRFFYDPDFRFDYLNYLGLKKNCPDDIFIKRMYKIKTGVELNLNNPRTFNEKLNWLKLYDRRPLYTTLVDKHAVKEWVADKIGEQYVIPTLGLFENFDDIDFEKLPNQFVLKCTHDSGGLVICKDKQSFNINAARKKINNSLKRNFYYQSREWPYKNVPPRIIAEKYMEDKRDGELRDYKFYTFNGVPKFLLIASNRHIKGKKGFDYFDMDFKHLDLQDVNVPNSPEGAPHKPDNFEKMKNFCTILAKNIPMVRVDFYEVDSLLLFGEMTFFDDGGFMKATPKSWEMEWGNLISLPINEVI